ncbi:sensor histidine kinase [Hamadaea tsunoensis]|uniref:sensor histidine kinase n=1 Tax=Hamadaea tsunoensis TaxID=53368 RepID=UPI0004823195|nr:sensor histidine kinase [Hamadaea tsunoensis]
MRVRPVLETGLVVWMAGAALYMANKWADPQQLWRDTDLLADVLLVAVHVPLLLRRRFPVGALAATSAAVTVYLAFGYYHSVTTFAIALAVYSLAAYRPRRISLSGAAAGAAIQIWGSRLAEPGFRVSGAAIATMLILIAWAFGDGMRQLAERGERLAQLSRQLRDQQEERAQVAVAREQRRIAREVHDVVAHHMSVISVQAGLGEYVLDSDPGTARAALRVISDTAHEALAEMRRLLSVLRLQAQDAGTDDAPYDATPGLARIEDLLERVRGAGARVDLVSTGPAVVLAPGVDLCVYRVIQESLTNVLRHAEPPVATVSLGWTEAQLTVRVTDEGAAVAPSDSPGYGLVGLRERARIYGGTLTAGPRPEGGFTVALTVPTREPL